MPSYKNVISMLVSSLLAAHSAYGGDRVSVYRGVDSAAVRQAVATGAHGVWVESRDGSSTMENGSGLSRHVAASPSGSAPAASVTAASSRIDLVVPGALPDSSIYAGLPNAEAAPKIAALGAIPAYVGGEVPVLRQAPATTPKAAQEVDEKVSTAPPVVEGKTSEKKPEPVGAKDGGAKADAKPSVKHGKKVPEHELKGRPADEPTPAPARKAATEEPQLGPKKPLTSPAEARSGEVRGIPQHDDDLVVVRELRDVKEVIYNPDAVPHINCGPHITTSIFLPEGEQIQAAIIGNLDYWDSTPVPGENVIFIRPKTVGLQVETNLIVITKKRNVYNFGLLADPNVRPLKTLRVLPPGWMKDNQDDDSIVVEPGTNRALSILGGQAAGRRLSPEDLAAAERRGREQAEAEEAEREKQFITAMLAQRNDDYKVSYQWGCPFKVLNIFDASGVTYIRIDSPTGAEPVIYQIDEDGREEIINYRPHRLDPNVLMIDRRIRKAVIKIGKKGATITNVGLERQIKNLRAAR